MSSDLSSQMLTKLPITDSVKRSKPPVYMPHPGHFICGRDCKFFLNTYVNGYIVSTVGEYLPDYATRPRGYIEIGAGRLYETMVFRGGPSDDECCPYRIIDFSQRDFAGYNTAADAYKGHRRMVKKWSKEKVK